MTPILPGSTSARGRPEAEGYLRVGPGDCGLAARLARAFAHVPERPSGRDARAPAQRPERREHAGSLVDVGLGLADEPTGPARRAHVP